MTTIYVEPAYNKKNWNEKLAQNGTQNCIFFAFAHRDLRESIITPNFVDFPFSRFPPNIMLSD